MNRLKGIPQVGALLIKTGSFFSKFALDPALLSKPCTLLAGGLFFFSLHHEPVRREFDLFQAKGVELLANMHLHESAEPCN